MEVIIEVENATGDRKKEYICMVKLIPPRCFPILPVTGSKASRPVSRRIHLRVLNTAVPSSGESLSCKPQEAGWESMSGN